MRKTLIAGLASVALVAVASPASAALLTGSFAVNVIEGVGPDGNSGFSVADGNPFVTTRTSTATASFTYTGPINFFNNAAQSTGPAGDLNSAFGFSLANISGYSGAGTVSYNSAQVADYRTVGGFLGSSGSSAGFQYASYYTFDLGTILAGTVITITHDDGAAFYQGANRIGNTVAGPTGQSTSTFTVGATGNTVLRYSRQNGTPSILVVDAVAPVPEPATWGMMLLGFLGIGSAMRRRRAQGAIAHA